MRKEEYFAASVVGRFAPEFLGRAIGLPTERDGRDASGLLVDWSYDESEPPIALEVTACHTPGMRQTIHELERKLEPELDRLLAELQLGEWEVVVDVGVEVKSLVPTLKELIRTRRDLRVGDYNSEDLVRDFQVGELHSRLETLGLVELRRTGDLRNSISCMVTGGGPEIVSLDDALATTLDENRAKLTLDSYESHLAVVVFDFQLSTVPEVCHPPELGPGIDCLWVIHCWPGPTSSAEVWCLEANGTAWQRRAWGLPAVTQE